MQPEKSTFTPPENRPGGSAATVEPLDVVALYTKLLRVRARLGLFDSVADTRHFPTEIRLLDEVIEEVDRVLPG